MKKKLMLVLVLLNLFHIMQGDTVVVAFDKQKKEYSVLLFEFLTYSGPLWKILWQSDQGAKDFLKYIKLQVKSFNAIANNEHSIAQVKFVKGSIIYQNVKKVNSIILNCAWIPLSEAITGKANREKYGGGTEKITITDNSKEILKKAYEFLSPSKTMQQGGWNVPGAILFYDKDKPYGEFANTYDVSIIIDGQKWRSVEHYFQAQKAPFIKELLYTTPREFYEKELIKIDLGKLQNYMKKYTVYQKQWRKVSFTTMFKALKIKFNGSYKKNAQAKQSLAETLLQTFPHMIVEDAGDEDTFYGAGPDFKGGNHLGQMLMQIRSELRFKQQHKPYTRLGIDGWQKRLQEELLQEEQKKLGQKKPADPTKSSTKDIHSEENMKNLIKGLKTIVETVEA